MAKYEVIGSNGQRMCSPVDDFDEALAFAKSAARGRDEFRAIVAKHVAVVTKEAPVDVKMLDDEDDEDEEWDEEDDEDEEDE